MVELSDLVVILIFWVPIALLAWLEPGRTTRKIRLDKVRKFVIHSGVSGEPRHQTQGERMTYLLTNAEAIATITVAIYHRTGRNLFMDSSRLFNASYFDYSDYTFELAYAYEREDTDVADNSKILDAIFRENNAVDGSEINFQLEKRSLSVGDLIVVGNLASYTGTEVYEVQSFGFKRVSEMDTRSRRMILFRQMLARRASQELTPVRSRYISAGQSAGTFELEVI